MTTTNSETLVPKKAVSEITMIRPGKAISMSTTRCTNTSNQPLERPADQPDRRCQRCTPSATDEMLTPSEALPAV